MTIRYRKIQEEEYSFLKEMLYEALFVRPGQAKFSRTILEEPSIKKYVEAWNEQTDDLAIVALDEHELIGVIWARKFSAENKGYGYVDASTPEISMAIRESYRGQGIGTKLLSRIEDEFSKKGIQALSLSVDKLNPAKYLYERCGYKLYEEEGTAITMIKKLK